MQAEIDAEAATAKSPRFSWIVVAAAGVVFALSAPLAREYGVRLLFVRGLSGIAIQLAAGGLSLGVLVWALAKFPRRTALVLAAMAAVQTAASGNLAALLEAAAIAGCVVLLGDAATRALRGENPREGEWPTTFVAGAAAASILVLGLAETGLLRPAVLAGIAAVILAARWRRIPDSSRLFLRNDASSRDEIPGSLRILWTVLAVAAIAIVWLRVLEPDFYYDALAYHLPEARDVARHLRVDVAADLFPQSLLWRMHENFLALGFFLPQGERVVRFLNFFFGLAGFGASLLLARRVGDGASRSLVLLALVGFPVILFQLYSSNADWPAAAFVTAGAAEIAASRGRPEGAGSAPRSSERESRRNRMPCAPLRRSRSCLREEETCAREGPRRRSRFPSFRFCPGCSGAPAIRDRFSRPPECTPPRVCPAESSSWFPERPRPLRTRARKPPTTEGRPQDSSACRTT